MILPHQNALIVELCKEILMGERIEESKLGKQLFKDKFSDACAVVNTTINLQQAKNWILSGHEDYYIQEQRKIVV